MPLVLLSGPWDSHVYAPRCWRGGGLVADPRDHWMTLERFYVNALAKLAIRDDMIRRNEAFRQRQRALGMSTSEPPGASV